MKAGFAGQNTDMKKAISHFMEKRALRREGTVPRRPHKTTLSRFMKKTLLPDENLVGEARFHGFYTFTALMMFSAFALAGWGVQYAIYRLAATWTMMPVYIALGIGAWNLFWVMLKKWTTEIILTDQRLLYKQGFFQIDVAEVGIEQLASDYVQQTLLGRLLDYGKLHIRCIEAADIKLPDIARPYDFRNALELQKKAFREHYMQVEHLRRSHKGGHNGEGG